MSTYQTKWHLQKNLNTFSTNFTSHLYCTRGYFFLVVFPLSLYQGLIKGPWGSGAQISHYIRCSFA